MGEGGFIRLLFCVVSALDSVIDQYVNKKLENNAYIGY